LVGLTVLSGFTAAEAEWVNGRAYGPQGGRAYKSKLSLSADATLAVTGCVFFIRQSQRWMRMR
jgi:uncharacterized protein (DUF2147 family)